jgi:hypothetical protein
MELPAPIILGCHSPVFTAFIEDDGVLFFLHKVPILANRGHFFGLASGKIGMRGDILETRCHAEIVVFLRAWKR